MKIGVELQIDVTKIRKERIYNGKKGSYLTMTTFIDVDNQDQYNNNGMITHKKEEGEDRAPILGNCKVFWKDGSISEVAKNTHQPTGNLDDFDDDIPF